MSFCKYCGRQLQDGEVCTCQQAQQPAGAAQPQQEFNQQASWRPAGDAAADIPAGSGWRSDQREQVSRHISRALTSGEAAADGCC